MSISKYEAAALYHYISQKLESDKEYLVLDLDDCSYGYCKCSNENKTCLDHSWMSNKAGLWDACIKAIKKLVDERHSNDVEIEFQTQLSIANSSFFNYYLSDKAKNYEAFVFSDLIVTCEELERELGWVRESIQELVDYIKNQLTEEKLLKLNIIILGKAQEFYPIMSYLRELISIDPLFPDARFKNEELQDSYIEIVRLGNEYLESLKTLKYSYELLGFDVSRNSVGTIWSVKKGQKEMDIDKLQFSQPILVSKGDKLVINREASQLEIAIPYSFAPMDSDLIEVAVGVQEGIDTLFIRRCRFKTRIYNVKLF